jgi:hypothetical protein
MSALEREIAALRDELSGGFTDAVIRRLFLPAPAWRMTDEKRTVFAQLLETAPGASSCLMIDTPLPYPRVEFLRYLVTERGMLLHGSGDAAIDVLQPRPQYDFGGTPVTATFATADAIWPLFFALIPRETFFGSMRNGAFVIDGEIEQRFYFFSVNQEWLAKRLWRLGYIYAVPGETYRRTDTAAIYFDEWVSVSPVQPCVRVAVTPDDFPFLNQVAAHDDAESIYESWLRYRERIGYLV